MASPEWDESKVLLIAEKNGEQEGRGLKNR